MCNRVESIKTVLNENCMLSSHIVRRLNNKYKAKKKTPATNTRQCPIRTTNDTREKKNERRKRWSESKKKKKNDVLPSETHHTTLTIRIHKIWSFGRIRYAIVFYFRMNISWMVNCRDRKICFPSFAHPIHRRTTKSIFHIVWSQEAKFIEMRPKRTFENKHTHTHTFQWGYIGRAFEFILFEETNTKHIHYSTTIRFFFLFSRHTTEQDAHKHIHLTIISCCFPILPFTLCVSLLAHRLGLSKLSTKD